MLAVIELAECVEGPDAVVERICQAMTQESGWQVVKSFDLRQARTRGAGMACPRHGQGECTCQMVVLLLYCNQPGKEPSAAPYVIVVHGAGEISHVGLPAEPPAGAAWVEAVRRAVLG